MEKSQTLDEYYVYGLVDPRNKELFYVGKGKARRYLAHIKEYNKNYKHLTLGRRGPTNKNEKIQEILESGNDIEYLFFITEISEESAFCLEKILIDRLGRFILKSGKLFNLEAGGEPSRSGLFLSKKDKPTIDFVRTNYPELLPVLDQYPRVAPTSNELPWWEKEIPKDKALYQYDLEGSFIEVHDYTWIRFATGYKPKLIKECVIKNNGFAYNFQWSLTKFAKLENLYSNKIKLLKLREFSTWEIGPINNRMKKLYVLRNQEVT